VFVSGVLDGASGAVRFQQTVMAYNFVAVTFLSLLFDVLRMWVMNSIPELIACRSLKNAETC
jgi:hypothetical protein